MLELEEWLSEPSNGFKTREDEINCTFAETGLDRELDFNLENEILNLYNLYTTNCIINHLYTNYKEINQ